MNFCLLKELGKYEIEMTLYEVHACLR